MNQRINRKRPRTISSKVEPNDEVEDETSNDGSAKQYLSPLKRPKTCSGDQNLAEAEKVLCENDGQKISIESLDPNGVHQIAKTDSTTEEYNYSPTKVLMDLTNKEPIPASSGGRSEEHHKKKLTTQQALDEEMKKIALYIKKKQ